MKRVLVSALLLSACGLPGGDLAIEVQRWGLAGVVEYDVRVLGGAATCDAVLERPAAYLTARTCADTEVETATDCHLAHALMQPGATNRLDAISEGTRAVFVIGRDAQKEPVGKGCAAATVKSGAAAQVTVTVSPGF